MTRESISAAIASAFRATGVTFTDADLTRATGAAARVMLRASEGFIEYHSPIGPVEDSAYNGQGLGSFRAERHARDLRDIGALRFLAHEADQAGATSAAAHLRELANIFTMDATVDGYVNRVGDHSLTSNHDPRGFIGPAIGEAYHAPTDMFVDVLAREGHAIRYRSPMGYTDVCSPVFLTFPMADPAADLAFSYVTSTF